MTTIEIEILKKIENILYSNISFSRKMERLLPLLSKHYHIDFLAFVSASAKTKKYRIHSFFGSDKPYFISLLNQFTAQIFNIQNENTLTLLQKSDSTYIYVLPLKKDNKVNFGSSINFLYICYRKEITTDNLEALILLSRLIRNFYKFHRKIVYLENQYNKIKLLYEISKTIDKIDEVNIKESLSKVMNLIRKGVYYDYFSLYEKGESGILNKVDLSSLYEIDLLQDFKFHLGIGLSAWVAEAREPIIINDLKKKRRFKISEGKLLENINSLISMPLIFGGEVTGVLNLARIYPYKFYKKDLKMLEIIGSQVASIIENIKLLNRLENMAYTDGLTALFNYRYFIRELEKEIKRAKRYNYEISLIMIDIDDFKKVNDLFGHNTGNAVLKKLSEILSSSIRDIDIIARYGGEEFVILLPNTKKENAKILAERIRRRVEERFEIDSQSLPSITITLGISSFPRDGRDMEELIKKADIALYYGKNMGKNTTVLYNEGLNGK